MVSRIARLNSLQKEQVNSVLSEAFCEDPVFTNIFSSKKEISAFFNLAIEYVNTYGIIHTTDTINAVSLWMPPGKRFLYFGNSFGTFSLIRKSLLFIIKVKLSSIVKLLSISNFTSKNHPPSPHYYLFAIGVEKKSMGMGLGKKLINYAFSDFGDNQQYYLENSNINNLGFYKNLGFNLIKTSTYNDISIFHMSKNIFK